MTSLNGSIEFKDFDAHLPLGLTDKAETKQVYILIHSMDDATDDILKFYNLTEEEQRTYTTAKMKVNNHFMEEAQCDL